jgi:hypothetical protein
LSALLVLAIQVVEHKLPYGFGFTMSGVEIVKLSDAVMQGFEPPME